MSIKLISDSEKEKVYGEDILGPANLEDGTDVQIIISSELFTKVACVSTLGDLDMKIRSLQDEQAKWQKRLEAIQRMEA